MRNSLSTLAAIRRVHDEAASHIYRVGPECCRGCTLARQIPNLLDDTAELMANQLPEGGKWVTQYRHRNAPGALPASGWMDHAPDDPADCVANGCEQRRVYTTAVEPIVALDRVTEAGRGPAS